MAAEHRKIRECNDTACESCQKKTWGNFEGGRVWNVKKSNRKQTPNSAECYTSKQGYKVNLIQDTAGNDMETNYISEKCAVFVADCIRYTICGRTSMEMIKKMVDSME